MVYPDFVKLYSPLYRESLFTIFELQKYLFWLLKGHDTIKVNMTSVICASWKTQNITKSFALFSPFATRKFCSFWKQISPSILRAKNLKIHDHLESIRFNTKPFLNNKTKCEQWSQQGSRDRTFAHKVCHQTPLRRTRKGAVMKRIYPILSWRKWWWVLL